MAPKKNQKVKMSLNDFITTPAEVATPGGSWADDDVVEDLPTAPAARDEFGGRLDGSVDAGRPFGADTRDRPVVPLPTAPPFTAFLGNLNHSILEEEIESFFGDLNVTSVRIVKDISDRPKGFGYAEFDSLDDLKAALGKTGQQLAARPVRVTVAEPPKKGGFGGSFVDDKDAWRSARPAATDIEPINTDADDNINWRGTARPVAPPRSERGFGFKGGAPVDVDNKEWTRGSNFKTSPPVSQAGTDDASNWRSARPAPAGQSAAPGERRKLQLAPRGSTQAASSNQSAPSKPSPFGGARPVDTATREQSLFERSKAPAATGKPSSVAQPEKKKVRNQDNKFSFANAGLEVEGDDDDE